MFEVGQMSLIDTKTIGKHVRGARKRLGVTQKELAMTSGTGLRFIGDLEKGKPTCHLGKTLTVLQTVGIKLAIVLPEAVASVRSSISVSRKG